MLSMWIKLHYQSGTEVVVQTQNICMISSLDEGDGSIIAFVGTPDNDIMVRELMDEIGAMITE